MPKFVNARGQEIEAAFCPDGFMLRVPTFLVDGVQREVAANFARQPLVVDAFGRRAGHRPGYCFAPRTRATDARDAAYQEDCKRMENAWRDKDPSAQDAAPTPTDQLSASDAHDAREKAFAAHEQWLVNAWRTAR